MIDWLIGAGSRVLIWVKSKWSIIKRALAIFIVATGISLVAFSAWVNTFDPTGFGLLSDDDRMFWAKFGPISALFIVLAKSLWESIKSDGSLQHIIVSDIDKTDMKQMAKYMKGADAVVIYSGDFSYIYDYDPLYVILDDLSERENLRLISYKSEETVLARSELRREDRDCLVRRLMDTNKISFDVPGRAKFSLVYRRGEEVLLYRHREEETDYVTVFKAKNAMTKQLVETIKGLVEIVVKAHPPR